MMLFILLCIVIVAIAVHEIKYGNRQIRYIVKDVAVFVLLSAIIALLFSSCTRTVYVPVTSTKIEYKDRLRVDSTYLHDSIFIMKIGDTIYNKVYRTLYRTKIVRDSVFVADTIRKPYPVEIIKEVKKPLNWYEKLCLWGFSLVLAGSIGYVVRWLIKTRK